MNKICLIICYFGKLPNYFPLWEISASKNKKYDFLIFSDQDYKSNYSNIIFYKMSVDEVNSLFSQKLNMNIKIKKPYKFCDFRPAYGVIFDDYLKQYTFWGHCDIDQVFGNIGSFLNDNIFNSYDRINHLGHFCLYKNTEKINQLFKMSGSPFQYDEVFLSDENYAFDEISGIDMIVKSQCIRNYEIVDIADIDVKHKRYRVNNFKNYKNQYFTFDNGKIFHVFYKGNNYIKKEMLYLHFQKKKPIININDYDKTIYIGREEFTNTKSNNFNKRKTAIYELSETICYYFKKICDYFRSSKKQKYIWKKQKGRKLWKKV